MIVDEIRQRLADYEPNRIADPLMPRAAVAMVLRASGDDVEMLLIRRAKRVADPWSGQMGFPGGRREPEDCDLVETAVRETREEVALDLRAQGHLVGALDDLGAVAEDGPVDLVISPFAFVIREPVTLRPDRREVERVVWVPLSFLSSAAARTVHCQVVRGVEIDFPGYSYDGHIIWGLTHRILEQFLGLTCA